MLFGPRPLAALAGGLSRPHIGFGAPWVGQPGQEYSYLMLQIGNAVLHYRFLTKASGPRAELPGPVLGWFCRKASANDPKSGSIIVRTR